MKKITLICALLMAIPSFANATGPFVGADALFSNVRYEAKNSVPSAVIDGDVKKDTSFNFGANAGYRFDFLILMASGEIFYDSINATSRNFTLSASQNDGGSIQIDNRYGAKVNVGLAALPYVRPFLTYGFANVQYKNNQLANSVAKSELKPLYGVGLLIDLPFSGLSAKASYDYQQFDMKYAVAGTESKVHLGVAKLGVIYNF